MGRKNEDLDVILTLKTERYKNNVLFSVFNDHLKNHVAQKYKYAHDLIPIIDKYQDPKDDIDADCPIDLTLSESKSQVQ